mmetsp:Transcript_7855/g.7341  ORF Transcript_7855/g.7341 Transcript_7855/m.7341 type:complete len:145 (-) Transcript_7855:21-455(-)|eukprot:CAMPEP_0170540240 /NCGR_PEP_ID=MMETSP0211-20121228/269_1 /TAXON_ID=311385 /ORGANISM="Pseudokeronopsis sp., Strain OXSARD2" /LENGTH=144 /DNA_ID=CAMNT_0010842563 /DNA_START=2141 /DNA_END=2575 /DNA_ORIENTATION=-
MIDRAKKKDKFFGKGYKIIRSTKSRLVHLQKNSVNFNQIIFKKKKFDENIRSSELNRNLSEDEKKMSDFIKKCLQVDPGQRMSCEEALRHDWFKDILQEKERELDSRFSLNLNVAQNFPKKVEDNTPNLIKDPFEKAMSPKLES